MRLDVTTSSDSQTSATDEPSCSTPNTTTTSHTSPSDGAISPAKFAHAGVFVTDDHISIDITQQQHQQPPQTPTIVKPVNRHPPRQFDEVPIKPLVDTHIPRSSPMPARRKSIDSSSANGGPQHPSASQSAAAAALSRKIPAYRSMRKPATATKATPTTASKDKAPAAGHTWSGRTSVAVPKKRATLGPDTFSAINRPGSAASNSNGSSTNGGTGNHEHIGSGFNRNSAVRASQTLYDRNGRRVKSTNTSPTKSVSPSPLAQQILEAAGTARNDSQMLEKMKRLLSRYTTNGGGTGPDAAAGTVDDFTTAWVNSNGTLDRVGSSSSCSGSPIKMQSKRSSAASSVDSAQSRELAALAAAAAAPRPNRGTSRIPAPIRQNTVLY